ncbi:hypothetical protein [Emticicia sp. C21]|uniref:hypothetical protein n=1 Tax=Emticicia sp. C21 TaxID=2302915 RepID=UPI000E347A80|nr:hypothetical protein [Emticicia sp. C21]RFS14948.1 hypothetical protein D0T08_17835 [Emticicia sp. C21]
MSKVLTLHKLTNNEHWFSTNVTAYGKAQIDAIHDAEGGTIMPTSVPSPFARFDLVRSAFQNLSKNINLKGTKNDERLVSQCFDIGELFFNFDKLSDRLRIIKWDKEDDLKQLLKGNKSHKRLGEAYKLYFKEDAEEYNFDELKSIFILYYDNGIKSGFVGGTSPSTLFFSSPNDLSFIDEKLGSNKLFGETFYPLHKRDIQYQKLWYYLNKLPNFREKFKDISDYLSKSLSLLQDENPVLWREIGENGEKIIIKDFEKSFDRLTTGIQNEFVEVLGYWLRKSTIKPENLSDSGFIIKSSKYKSGLMPMVLQSNFSNDKIKYAHGNWDPKQIVPTSDPNPWDKRRLPGHADVYPWLTVSDFLEPHIVRLVYPVNSNCFFDGGWKGPDGSKGYLMPLKKEFFDFFNTTDLINGSSVNIEIKELAGGSVRVSLRIPIQAEGEYVYFTRLYMSSDSLTSPRKPNLEKNEGVVIEYQFGVNIMPFIKIDEPDFKSNYRIHLVDRDVDVLTYDNDYNLLFFDEANKQLSNAAIKNRNSKSVNTGATSKVYVLEEQNFDYIAVEVSGKRGLIIPKFPTVSMGDDVFRFAIDFGTTNTHIELNSTNNPSPVAFEISEKDVQIATLHDPVMEEIDRSLNGSRATAILDLLPMEMIPEKIGAKHYVKFPQRTALIENKPKYNETLHGMADFNVGFMYERKHIPKDIYTVKTNLKWENYKLDKQAEKRIEGFIESIMLLIRNKVLLNQGNLELTELVWFYPMSMLEGRRNFFEAIWQKNYKKLIGEKKVPLKIPESIAPFYWYNRTVRTSKYPAVSIDIGGGTTDVVVFQDDNPILATSFRFAANAIFGDGFTLDGAADRNGFIKKYESEILEILEANGFDNLKRAYEVIKDRQRSDDVLAFFFSLKQNKEIRDKVVIDFNEMLAKDESFKIVFLTFYTSIIYHIAKIMKLKGLLMPRYITFSGTGSLILDILSPKSATLSQLAKLVFERIYETEYHEDGIEIVKQDTPKEVTCKGGLRMKLDFNKEDSGEWDEKTEKMKTILYGTSDDKLASKRDTYNKIEELVPKVVEEVNNFIKLLFDLNNDFSFKAKFNMNTGAIENYKKLLEKDMEQNVREGLKIKKDELDSQNDPIEETLFFYPLIGALNHLAYEITK